MTDVPVRLRSQSTGSGPTCRHVLAALPKWFGIEQSVEDYVAVADRAPTAVASVEGADVGFLTTVRHSRYAAEVYVMGVLPEFHRHGVGRQLLEYTEHFLAADGVEFLQVKTLSSSKQDRGYERTRAFYYACGFRPLEELPNLWGPENPALQMVKVLRSAPESRLGISSATIGSTASTRLLVVVTGVQGTGKSTVADAVGQLLGAAVFAHDWAMSGLRPFPELEQVLGVMDPPGHRAVGWSILRSLARSELRRDRPAVLDGVARGEEIALCRRLADEEAGRVLLVATECSDVNLHRQRTDGRRRLIPDWYELTWDYVERTRASWETPTAPDLVLDAARPWEENEARLREILPTVMGKDELPGP